MTLVLEDELPAFSAVFHLHPWQVERLTMGQLETYRQHPWFLRALGVTDGG